MKNPKISAALATYNEEENITDCIEALDRVADEIVVVDGSSQDRTAEIAKSLGAKVIKTSNKTMFHINKNMAIDNCCNEWIFLIDADERINDDLAREIKQVVGKNPGQNGFLQCAAPAFERYLLRANRYTDETARRIEEKNPGRGPLPIFYYMIAKPFTSFLSIYFRHKGYQDGFRGFIWALFSSFHHFFAYVKYWSGEAR